MNIVYTDASFQNIILTVLAIIVIIIIIGCMYTFIRTIILFMFAHGREENKKKGWNSIRFMIIGVILTIFFLVMIPVVLKWMKVPEYDTYNTTNIFNRVGQLINGLFNLGDIIRQSQQNSKYRGHLHYDIDSPQLNEPTPITNDIYTL